MNARVPSGWLIAAMLLAGTSVRAQGVMPAGGPGAPADRVMTTQHLGMYLGVSGGHGQACPCRECQIASYEAELLPADRGFIYDTDSRLDLILHESMKGMWFRLEYLHANIHRDSGRTLGTPLQGVRDVSQQFPIVFTDADPLDDIPPGVGMAQVPTTGGINWDDTQGIRGTFGIPVTKYGWVEASFMGLGEQTDSIQVPTLPGPFIGPHGTPPTQFLATTLTTDGVPGSRVILYDRSFSSEYSTDLYTADVNFVYNLKVPDEGWLLQPMIGYRHEEYGERLTFGGTFDNNSGFLDGVGILANPQSNGIDSKVRNFRNQLQLGFRSELVHRAFALGVEPKVALGSNLVRSRVAVQTVRNPGNIEQFPDPALGLNDPALTVTEDRELLFAPTVDVGLYAKVNLKDWFRMKVGYSFIWMGEMGVADASIRFNETTDPVDPTITNADVVLDRQLRSRLVGAWTIGGEILLP